MAQEIIVNGVDRTAVIRDETCEWVTHAYVGEIGVGKFVIDDTAGTIVVPGWKGISVEQDASTPSSVFRGFSHSKLIRRGKSARTLASREYEVATQDGNDLLRRFVIRDRKRRPAENVNQRIGWLLEEELSRVGVADYGRVQSSTAKLDKDQSVKGRYPVDILGPIAKAIGFNFYVRWNWQEEGWELVFRDDNDSTADTCTLSISNVATEINGLTIFEPLIDAQLTQDAENVYSGAYGTHDKGNIYERRAATATAFADRDGITEDAGIRTDTTARRDARRFLRESKDEEQSLPVTIRVPETHAGLVEAGMRISTRLTHMAPEGWDPARYARILRLRTTRFTDGDYQFAMDLSPQEDGEGESACPFELTEAGTFYPLGWYQFDGWNWQANPSDGVVYYLRPGYFWPTVPTPGHLGNWHFFATTDPGGGAGEIDYWGGCVQNQLQFIVVGPGTLTIQTEVRDGVPRPVHVSWGESPDAYSNFVGQFTTGDAIEVEVTGDCVNLVRLQDASIQAGPGTCSGGGWSQMDWVPA